MRTILAVIAFLSSFCCFSQVIEDFSDGDFTQNPVWTGDIGKFIVDSKKQLKLNVTDTQGGYAGLYTKSSIVRNTKWEFYTHLLFNPSANNYAMFFLADSEPGFGEKSGGYVVKVGGEKDELSFCRMDQGVLETLIEGRRVMKGINSPQLNIRVECDREGNWSLWSKLLNNESEYTKEGIVKDTCYLTTSFVGVGCVYTSSRGKSFIFDDLTVTDSNISPGKPDTPDEPDEPVVPDPDDKLPPRIVSLIATADTVVTLDFNEAISIGKATFSIDSSHRIKNEKLSESARKLELLLTNPLENNHEYTLNLNGISDLSGNLMPGSSIRFNYYDTSMQTVAFANVVINEIMANPKGVKELPESEYIELFNRTEAPVSLKGWRLMYGNKPYLLPDQFIAPEGYLVLCSQKFAEAWNTSGVEVAAMNTFPALANSGKLIYLEDSRNKLISWVNYTDNWYKDDFKKKGGFSLECVDPDNLSGNENNWKASCASEGGTPGKVNSVSAVAPDDSRAEIDYFYMNAPDTLVITFTKPMSLASLSNQHNFQITNQESYILKALPEYPECRSVALILSEKIQEEIQVEVSGVKDISGYDLEGFYSFRIGMPANARLGDLVFNEIMFNPLPGESDYVELFNTSDKYILLESLRFTSQKVDGTLSEALALGTGKRVFTPLSYLCFTRQPELINDRYTVCKNKLIKLNALPSLPDDKGNILLTTFDGEILDRLDYTEKMHSSLLDDKEGIALEKINPGQESHSSSGWLSASSPSGGGTPGCQNSQYRESSEETDQIFRLENNSFSPDGDGIDDEMILRFYTSGENFQANIKIFDAEGRLVNTLVEDFRLGTEGYISWNGKNRQDQLASIGIYIIYIEVYNPKGDFKRFKLACALTK